MIWTLRAKKVIIDVRQSQLFLLGTISKTAHGMRELFVRPQPLCLCHVPCRSASRPLAFLASELNEHQPQQLQQHRKESCGKDDYRKREGCCPAAPRFGYPPSPVTYTRITVYTTPRPAQEEPTSYITDCGCLPRRVTQQQQQQQKAATAVATVAVVV